MFSDKLQSLRKNVGISQEKLAAVLNVSRQAVQKWETGVSMPDIDNLKALSNFFNVTVDHMLFGEENRSVEELRVGISIEPVFDKWHNWEAYYRMLPTEYRQCVDEGKKISSYETLFKAVAAMPDGKHKSDLSDILFNIVQDTPLDENYPYVEPSDLESIFSCTDGNTYDLKMPDRETLEKRIAGAYYGRVCGCLLGKPMEGMKFPELTSFLECTGNSPMYRYIAQSDCDKADSIGKTFQFPNPVYPDENMDAAQIQEQGNQIAREWAKAMEDGKNGMVRDFVAVGDVQIKVIGGEAPILDSEVPVRQILEQLVAKTGLPPFLLGISWSTTERMSTQQADILTTELWALRRTVEPVVRKICRMFLALEGLDDRVEILWNDISLQDITEEAKAQMYQAQAAKYRMEAEA